MKSLWPAGIVDFDNGLNVAVRKLRVALNAVSDTPKYIETLPVSDTGWASAGHIW